MFWEKWRNLSTNFDRAVLETDVKDISFCNTSEMSMSLPGLKWIMMHKKQML